ncbi:helix-turn-helix domain-containing protein [candidate division KSB1 bacterium]|nr:helix-turn-helix domain-containing protein [candidate division KSB1 bacterium]
MATDIQQLLRADEGETLEFKQSVGEIRENIETAGAFANGQGGTIVIGATSSGKVLGVDIGKDTLESLANSIQQQTDPKVFPSIRVAEVEGKSIVILRIEESPIKPVLVQGRGYKRVGKSDHVLSSSELTRLFFSSGEISWDAGPSLKATLNDIDTEALHQFLKRARQERNMAIEVEIPLPEVLEKLELLYEGRPSRAAVLLFGKRPQKFLLSSELRCARFKGTEPLHFIDMKVIDGNIIEQVPATMEFIQRHISMAAEIVPTQIERQERWEYPLEALREAIINATCHRDYRDSGNVQVRIFDDRVEVWSPGLLPEGITIGDLYRTHNSRPRNHRIARAFFLIRYIEHWGTGTLRMINLCRDASLPDPEFAEVSGAVVVTFRKAKSVKKYHEGPEQIERQRRAIEYVQQKGRITTQGYAEFFNVSTRTARRDLTAMVDKGIFRRAGKSKATYFELTKADGRN